MGEAIPRQQPAVVLRSHFNQLRALLAVTLIAVAGLTIAVVILADDSDNVAGTSSAKPVESIRYGGFNPATGRPDAAPLAQSETSLQNRIDGTRYDGGPEEGTRGVVPAQSPSASSSTAAKHEAATAAAIAQSTGGTELRGSKASQYGTSQYRLAPSQSQPDGDANPHGPAAGPQP
jgi:hypothetical protein